MSVPLAHVCARSRGVALATLALVALVVAPAAAQSAAPSPVARQPRLELSGGGVFVGGYGFGESLAELTSNGTSGPFALFTTDNRVRPVIGLLARIGFVVTPALVVEGGLRFTRPVLEVKASADTEGAPSTTIEETLSAYVFEGSAVWHFTRAVFAGGRALPFVYGGAGYMRELHEEDALIEEGVEYHAGGGIKWWLGNGPRRFGVRGEAGISIRDGGFDFAEERRVVPTVSGSIVYTF